VTEPEGARLSLHVTLRDVGFLVGIGLAVHLLLPQLGGVRRSADAVPSASLPWLGAAAMAFAASVAGGGAALMGATTVVLSPLRSAAVAFAATAVGHLSPGGVAGLRLVQRSLEHSGADRDEAVGAVALVQVAQVVVTVVALVASVLVVGTSDLDPVHLPGGWALVVGATVAFVAVGLLLRSRVGHRRLVVPARTAARSALAVLRHPGRAALLVGGTAAEVLALALGLAACLEAFGASPPLAHVVATYLVATVVGTVSPTPGGVGAFEATVAAGLTGLGVQASAAVPAVLAFRLLTFWLPIPVGAVLFGVLRHERDV
jgi:glycosyltransferase 2 family protein